MSGRGMDEADPTITRPNERLRNERETIPHQAEHYDGRRDPEQRFAQLLMGIVDGHSRLPHRQR